MLQGVAEVSIALVFPILVVAVELAGPAGSAAVVVELAVASVVDSGQELGQ